MKMEEGDETDGLESQRQVLADMSQTLLGRLNAMVAEQEQRAREFAARAHSLSSLPEIIEQVKAEPADAAPQEADRVLAQAPPLVRAADRQTEKPAVKRECPAPPRRAERKAVAKAEPTDTPEGSIGVGKLIFIGAVIYMLLRSCS